MFNPTSDYSPFSVAVQTAENLITAASTLEAAFYGCLKINASEDHKVVKQLRTYATNHLEGIQTLFTTINALATLHFAKRLLSVAEHHFDFSVSAKVSKLFELTKGQQKLAPFGLAVGTFVAVIGGNLLYEKLKKTAKEEPSTDQISVTEQKGFGQKSAQFFHTLKLTFNCASLVFSKNLLAQLIDIPTTFYSLLKNNQIKWLCFTQQMDFRIDFTLGEHPFQKHHITDYIKFKFNMLQQTSISKADGQNDQNCANCQGKKHGLLESALCAHHLFHRDCLKEIISNSHALLLKGDKYQLSCTQFGMTKTPRYYDANLDEQDLPKCPVEGCDALPHNFYEVQLKKSKSDRLPTHLNVERKTAQNTLDLDGFIDRCLVGYEIVRAGLAYLQTYPALAATIYKIQSYMVVTDCLILIKAASTLNGRIEKRGYDQGTKKILFFALTAIGSVASYFAMSKINAYAKSAIVLKEILSKLPIAPDLLKNVSADWEAPVVHKALQCLYINRVVATVALSFFEKNRNLYLLAAAAQLFTLGEFSSLKWIQFQQIFNEPLKTFVNQGAVLENVNPDAIKQLTLTSTFLVSRFQALSPVRLQDTLLAIYNFTQKTFANSSWNRFWDWVKEGNYLYKRLHYSVKLQNQVMEIASQYVPPYLWNHTLAIFDKTNGLAIALTST